jgi:hypothetical protein
VTLMNYGDNSLLGAEPNGINNFGIDEPDVAAGSLNLNHNPRNGQPYFNTALFSENALGTPGDASRRYFHGPGMENFDMALLKNLRLTESKSLQFRLEAFKPSISSFVQSRSVLRTASGMTATSVAQRSAQGSSSSGRLPRLRVNFTYETTVDQRQQACEKSRPLSTCIRATGLITCNFPRTNPRDCIGIIRISTAFPRRPCRVALPER